MKRNSLKLAATVLALVCFGVVGCGKSDPTPTPTPSVVEVEKVEMKASTTIDVGAKETLQATVTPANATDKTLTWASNDTSICSVTQTGEITGVAAGNAVVSATSKNGKKAECAVTVKAVVVEDDPTLTLSSYADLTVNAGESIALPTASAVDYEGTDLTNLIEIEDEFETGTIGAGTFLSYVAGVHNIGYYVESPKTGRFDEASIKVTVVPATPETVLEDNDISNLADYGTYVENFQDGYACQLHVGDGNDATMIAGTEQAINGNSLIIESALTRGNAAYSVFLVGCDSYMPKGRKATYKLEFDYKVLKIEGEANPNSLYCGLRCDSDNGDNYNFMTAGSEIGTVYHSTRSFASKYYGEDDTNLGFFFFDMNSSGDIFFVIDNFSITVEDCPQFVNYVASVEELKATNGFTWNWTDSACASMSGALQTKVENIEDEEIKEAIQADTTHFGTHVMHVMPVNGTDFEGLNSTNMINNYVDGEGVTHKFTLIIDFAYYCVTDYPYILPMNNGVQNGLLDTHDKVGEGPIKTVHIEHELNGVNALRFYDGASKMEFYLGDFTAKLVEETVQPQTDPESLLGYHLGDVTVDKGPQIDAAEKGISWADNTNQAEKDAVQACPEMAGFEPTRINPNADGTPSDHESQRTLVYPTSGLEGGCKYMFEFKYFVASSTEDASRRIILLLQGPNGQMFVDLEGIDFSVGYHEYRTNIVMDDKGWAGSGINLYILDESQAHHFSYALYFKSVKATLVGIKGFAHEYITEKGLHLGDVSHDSGCVSDMVDNPWGNMTSWADNQYQVEKNALANIPQMAGLEPTRIEFPCDGAPDDGTADISFTYNKAPFEAGVTYRLKLSYAVIAKSGNASYFVQFNGANCNFVSDIGFDRSLGYHEVYLDVAIPEGHSGNLNLRLGANCDENGMDDIFYIKSFNFVVIGGCSAVLPE